MWLIVVAIIIALLFIILYSSVKILFSFDESFILTVRFLSFVVYQYRSDNDKNTENETTSDFKGTIRKITKTSRTYDDIIAVIDILKGILNRFKKLLKHIVLADFQFVIRVVGDDAADTAIRYGTVCSALYPLTNLLNICLNFKPDNISVFSDFSGQETKIQLKGKISIKLIYLLSFAVSSLIKIIKIRMGVNSK